MQSTMFRTAAIVSFAASIFGASGATAAVLDFNTYTANTAVTSAGLALAHGYRVTHGGSGFGYVMRSSETAFNGNGSGRLIGFNQTEFTLTASDNGLFSLSGFDGGESWLGTPHYHATSIKVVGTLAGGATTTQTFALDLIKDPVYGMQSFSLGGSFANLQSVTFSGIGGNPEFSLDNIAVSAANAVPEPASLALFGLGAAGFAASRRRGSRAASPR